VLYELITVAATCSPQARALRYASAKISYAELVGEAGVYVCRGVDRQVSRGLTYFGTRQMARKNYPVGIGTQRWAQPKPR